MTDLDRMRLRTAHTYLDAGRWREGGHLCDQVARTVGLRAVIERWRARDRLFEPPSIELPSDLMRCQDVLAPYVGEPVYVAKHDERSGEDLVGMMCWPGQGWGGWGVIVRHFNHGGTTTHTSPHNVADIVLLPLAFKDDIAWEDERDEEDMDAMFEEADRWVT